MDTIDILSFLYSFYVSIALKKYFYLNNFDTFSLRYVRSQRCFFSLLICGLLLLCHVFTTFITCCVRTYVYSDSQKHESSCLLSDCFSCISPEPLELKKSYLHLFASLFKELSDEKRIFQIRLQNQLIFAKTLF